ncbi:hypothetical protein [Methylobacter psychrophilus]|uniref:hypothetical protein n=1 Tax=Methylobacter psychrophilus TaxID=96941 RepID=UPI0021D491C9|nr:hypothetical protein [Methylobacter psychrophilus]
MKKLHLVILLLATLIFVGGELLARYIGVVDFPLYDANPVIGYIPTANQNGRFLNSHEWQFNEKHMGASIFVTNAEPDVLLVGDSIVLGGNPLTQADRLGPKLQKVTSYSIWPISAGSWALRNELAYLRANPDVLKQMDAIVFVFNSGDFGDASSWKCELTHPRNKPTLALWYLFNKYVYSFYPCAVVPDDLQVPAGDVWLELAEFLKSTKLKPLYIIYPDKPESLNAELRHSHFAPYLAKLSAMGGRYVLVADDKRWSANYYRDGIHPSAEGNHVLAEIIADALKQ